MKLDNVIVVHSDKTIYRDGDKAIKLFNKDANKANILNEALNHARVEETGLCIPKLHEVTTVNGQWAIVMDFIEGKTMKEMMSESPAYYDSYLDTFVDLQLSVFSQKAPLLPTLRDKMQRKISQSALDATTRYELHTRLSGMPRHDKLCHGDFSPSNIIFNDKDGKTYIIDWAHATQGNASADAARTFLLFKLAGQDKNAEQYIQLFCRKTDTARQYVEKWVPIVAASQSVKGKPEEMELLLRFADVVDYE